MRAKYLWFISLLSFTILLFAQIVNCTEAKTIMLTERFTEATMVVGEKESVFVDIHRQISPLPYETLTLNVNITLDPPDIAEVINLNQPIYIALGSSFPIWISAKTVGVVKMEVSLYSKDPTINIS